MALIVQTWEAPEGPDGWPEDDAVWLPPQVLPPDCNWRCLCHYCCVPIYLTHGCSFNPRWGGRDPKIVHLAAKATESRAEGIGLVPESTAFQRL